MATRKNLENNVKARREGAALRVENRSKLSAQDQVKVLDVRLGVGVGAKRERARLAKQV